MGGCRCSFRNCTNTTKTRDKLHFFHYPVKQKERCRKWIDNAGKPQFYDLDEDQLRNKVICETHFEDCFFPNSQKKRLLQNAVPTLKGDSEPTSSDRNAIKDVQVLPANADGTNFVLEINMQQNSQGNKIESYIYTNNGLVLPINNSEASDEIAIYSESEEDVVVKTNCSDSETSEQVINSKTFDTYIEEVHASPLPISKLKNRCDSPMSPPSSEDMFYKSVNDKYLKKIKQHSKDIAILKRILKKKRPYQRPSNYLIVNTLRKQLAPSLVNIVNYNLKGKCDFSADDLEFFSTVHSTSPELYKILSDKYKWKLPSPELFNNVTNKNNGHVLC